LMDRLANEWYIMQRAKCKTVDQTYEFLAPGRQGSPLGEQGRRGREEERKEETGEQGWHFLISPPTCALGEPRSIEGCTEYLTMPPITGYRCITRAVIPYSLGLTMGVDEGLVSYPPFFHITITNVLRISTVIHCHDCYSFTFHSLS